MCRHSELPQGSKMGTTRAGSAVSMEAKQLRIKNYISEYFLLKSISSEYKQSWTLEEKHNFCKIGILLLSQLVAQKEERNLQGDLKQTYPSQILQWKNSKITLIG